MSGVLNWLSNFPVTQYAMGFFQEFIIKVLKTGPVPGHIAFIMDGNRRFAKFNQLELREGHVAGADSLLHIIEFCSQVGIKAITIYAFSIENFNRPKHEVDYLLDLLRSKLLLLTDEEKFAEKTGLKINVLGNRDFVPDDILDVIHRAETSTVNNKDMILNVAFPYTTRDDIVTAMKSVIGKVKKNELDPDQIDLTTFEKEIATNNGSPPLDILVRTGGATRLSDYMLWETNINCNVEFVETLWPDLGMWDMYRICLKWSWQRTKELSDLEVMQAKRVVPERPTMPERPIVPEKIDEEIKKKAPSFRSTMNLPPPPPVITVSEVDKSRALGL